MASTTTNAAVIFCVLIFVQVWSAPLTEGRFEPRGDVPATMTVNGFQQGEGNGGPASCDGLWYSDADPVVSLSSEWYADGVRCGRTIILADSSNLHHVNARVVDECAGCDNEVGASSGIWKAFNLDPSLQQVDITWSDENGA